MIPYSLIASAIAIPPECQEKNLQVYIYFIDFKFININYQTISTSLSSDRYMGDHRIHLWRLSDTL